MSQKFKDWMSKYGENTWISDYLSTNTPYRYIKLDTEKKIAEP